MEAIWKIWDEESFNNYEEYEKSKPDNIFNYYGEKLEEDTNNLLTYEVINKINDDFKENTFFYCQVPKSNPFHKDTKYSILLFSASYQPLQLYPCRFRNLLSKEVYECESAEELKNRIENEIGQEQTKNALGKLLYHFYDKETIKTIK